MTRLIKDHYKYDGQVIPVWGNHGCFPNDLFDYRTDRDTDLLMQLSNAWRSFIGDKAFDQFNKTGYYSVNISEKLGVKGRFIIFNSMLHDTLNFFNF